MLELVLCAGSRMLCTKLAKHLRPPRLEVLIAVRWVLMAWGFGAAGVSASCITVSPRLLCGATNMPLQALPKASLLLLPCHPLCSAVKATTWPLMTALWIICVLQGGS